MTPDLPDDTRAALVTHWLRRAASEERIGRGFAAIAPRLREVGAPAVVVDGCHQAAAEERRHAELCVNLARRYAGADPGPIPSHPFEVPNFGTEDERLELVYLVVGTCCINETLAVAYIRACLEAATDITAIAANRMHLRDEVGHGRLGWALLASDWIDDDMRAALGHRLPALLAANVPLWLRADPALDERGAPAYGHPALTDIRAAIGRAVDEVVLPGFRYVGIDAPTALI